MKNFSVHGLKHTGGGIFILPLLILSLFVSCEYAPTWDDPVREYFEYYTETAAIGSYELLQPYLVDRDGNVCLTSESDKELTLYARNPKKYTLLSSWTPNEPGTGDVTVEQDPDDPTVFHFRFSQAFLANHERGGDIGGTITQTETVSQRVFEKESFKLNMRCNSAPPEITDAAVMSVTEPDNSQTYVLAFNRPGKALCQSSLPLGIHHDIASISINGVTYPVSISDDGVMSFPEDRFTTTRPESLATINRKFEHSSQSIYFLSGEPLIEGTKTYTAGFTDAAGLSTSITVDTQVPRLSAPVVKDNDEIVITAGTSKTIHTDSGTSVSTLTIEVPTMDEVDNPVEDVNLYWELYGVNQTTGEETKISPSGSETCPSTSDVNVQIPTEGWYVLRTWATKSGLRDSAKMEYRLVLEYPKLNPPVVKDDTTALTAGESESVNNYILIGNNGKGNVTVSAPSTDTAGINLSPGDVTVYYTTDGSTQTEESQSSPLSISFDVGQHVIKAYAHKPGYRDSDVVTYRVRPFSTDIYVKSSGNDTTGYGTTEKPYASLTKAGEEIATFNVCKAYTIHVIGEIKGTQVLGNISDTQASSVTITGDSTTGVLNGDSNGPVLTTNLTNVPVKIKNLKITGGSTTNGGGLKIQNGTVTLQSGVDISGNSATVFGGGIYNGGTLTIESGVTISGNSTTTSGGGIFNVGTLTIESGTISGNTATTSGGGIYNSSDSVQLTIKGGTIKDNTATTKGSGIYAGKGFTVTKDAQIDESNDVFLVDLKLINIDGTLNKNSVATINKDSLSNPDPVPDNKWIRGTQVLSGDVSDAASTKFKVARDGWYVRNYSGAGYLDAPIYISGSGSNSSNSGATETDAYKTLDEASRNCWNDNIDFTINVVGEVTYSHTIGKAGTPIKAKSLTIEGTDSGGTLKGQSSNKSVLTVNTSVPVTIKKLTITGGTYKEGAGIYIASGGTVKLGDGATVTGNQATANTNTDFKGGGVYVSSGANLFMYGSALIGDKSKTNHAEVTDYGNIAGNSSHLGFGGGIYNGGTVYLGYDDVGSEKAIDDGYGVRYNYAEYGGGIYNTGIIYLNTGHISYNGSSDSGGGINNQSGTINMSGGTIEGNYARSCGGGLFINVVTITTAITMTGGYFYSNSAAWNGGAVWIGDATFEMTGGTIGGSSKDNTCGNEYNGGAIYSDSTYSTFRLGGTAQIPGGSERVNDIYLGSGKTIDLKSPLTAFSPAAKITLEEYKYNTQVVKPDGVTNGDVITACTNSLSLTSNSYLLSLANTGYTSINFSDVSSYQDIASYPNVNWGVSNMGLTAETTEYGNWFILIKRFDGYAIGKLQLEPQSGNWRPLSFTYKLFYTDGTTPPFGPKTQIIPDAEPNTGGIGISLHIDAYRPSGEPSTEDDIWIELWNYKKCGITTQKAQGLYRIP